MELCSIRWIQILLMHVMAVAVEGKPKMRILVNPLGSAIEVLLPPIAKWQPKIIYAFTSMDGAVADVEKHLNHSWRKHCGPDGLPTVRTVWIDEPWKANTIQDMMKEFDTMVAEALDEFKAYEIEWHVGITGGTNMMPVAMALSASTYSFPVYYAQEIRHNAELAETPANLVLELPLFTQLGPGVQYFSKSRVASEIFEVMLEKSQPMTRHEIAFIRKRTEKSVYHFTQNLHERGLIRKVGTGIFEPTTIGRLAYDRSRGIE